MDLANLATVESLGLLSDYDEMAVLAVDTAAHVIIPRSPVSKVRQQQSNILNIQSMGGGIFVYTGLQAAIKQLQGSTSGIKHILLFSDAADSEEPGKYRELLAAAREEEITCSVVGLGTRADKDAEFLLDVAARGNGQCFFSNDAMEIPRLFAQDTFMVARNTWITNQVLPRFTAALGSLSDRLPANAPPVGGYNLCYAKADATVVAMSSDEHDAPLLALRHYGIGRVAAFTGEADGHDAGPFARWSGISEFYAALARYCAGATQQLAADGLYIRQRFIPGGVRVEVYIDPKHPTLPNLEELTLHTVRHGYGSAPKATQLATHWRNTHTLSADIALQGNETLLATIILPDGTAYSLPPVALPYSPEYAPDNNNEGRALLAELAAATGGSALADVGDIWKRLPRSRKAIPLASWAYLLAALLFLIEIFERRTYWLERNIFVQSRRPQRATTQSVKPEVKKVSGRQRKLKEAADESVSLPKEAATIATPESPLQQAKRRARERTR
jgi:hypothetical protein